MPKIIPIKDLKNTAEISEMCHTAEEPIYVTKNGYGDMVIMSVEMYESTMKKLKCIVSLNFLRDRLRKKKQRMQNNLLVN